MYSHLYVWVGNDEIKHMCTLSEVTLCFTDLIHKLQLFLSRLNLKHMPIDILPFQQPEDGHHICYHSENDV